MVLDLPGGLFEQRDVRETPSSSSSSSTTTNTAPIGAIIAWLKSYTNTPAALPTGWMEADGSAINDADSVYNGQNAPDLNGGEFIRGAATSGGTGGSDTMAHTHTTNVTIDNHAALTISNESSHTHSFSDTSDGPSGNIGFNNGTGVPLNVANNSHLHNVSGTTGTGSAHTHGFSQNINAHTENNPATSAASNTENRPKYYNVVWIFRFK